MSEHIFGVKKFLDATLYRIFPSPVNIGMWKAKFARQQNGWQMYGTCCDENQKKTALFFCEDPCPLL